MSKAKHKNINAGFYKKVKEGESIERVLNQFLNFTKKFKKSLREKEAYQKPSEIRRKKENNKSKKDKARAFQKEREDRS